MSNEMMMFISGLLAEPIFLFVGFFFLTRWRLQTVEEDVKYLKAQNCNLIRMEEKVNNIEKKQDELLDIIRQLINKTVA